MYDNNDDIFGDITEPFIQDDNNDQLVAGAYLFDDERPAGHTTGRTSSSGDDDGFTYLIATLMAVGVVVFTFAPFIQKFYRGAVVPLFDGIVRLASLIFG